LSWLLLFWTASLVFTFSLPREISLCSSFELVEESSVWDSYSFLEVFLKSTLDYSSSHLTFFSSVCTYTSDFSLELSWVFF
jgi:hypothetical protein